MKKVKIVWASTLVLALMTLPVFAEEASVAMGKKLFGNPGLGASQNSISCNTCHENGGGLERAGANPRLVEVINMCIKGPLQGEPLSEKSVAMESLQMYLQSLAQ